MCSKLGYIDLDGLSNALGYQRGLPAALAIHFDRARARGPDDDVVAALAVASFGRAERATIAPNARRLPD